MNNNIRSAILEIKMTDVKLLKYLYFVPFPENIFFLLYYHLFAHAITFSWFTNIFSDLSYASSLDILSYYFISFIVWIADIGQVSVNVTLIIALIISFTF